MSPLICTRCGASQAGLLRHCQRCSLALQPARHAASGLAPQPLVPAAIHPDQAPVALVAGQGGRPLALLPALDMARPQPARAGMLPMPGLPRGPLALRRLAWVTGGLVSCAGLLMGARLALPAGAGVTTLAALASSATAVAEPAAQVDTEAAEAALPTEQVATPQAADPATPDPAALAQAINQSLQSQGLGAVRVHLSDDGTATVSGQVPAGTDAAELLRWVAAVPGVASVKEALTATPAPQLARRQPRQAPVADAEDAEDSGDEDADSLPVVQHGNRREVRTQTTTVRIFRQTR